MNQAYNQNKLELNACMLKLLSRRFLIMIPYKMDRAFRRCWLLGSYQHKAIGKQQTVLFIKYFHKLLLFWSIKYTSHWATQYTLEPQLCLFMLSTSYVGNEWKLKWFCCDNYIIEIEWSSEVRIEKTDSRFDNIFTVKSDKHVAHFTFCFQTLKS